MRGSVQPSCALSLLRHAALLLAALVGAQRADAQPSVVGHWEDQKEMKLTSPGAGEPTGAMQAIHSILLHTGKVLCIDREHIGSEHANIPDVVLFDPSDESIDLVWEPDDPNDPNGPTGQPLFCSGHAALADGRLLFVGGGSDCGTLQTALYDPLAGPVGTFLDGPDERWCEFQDQCPGSERDIERWYPTVTTLGDGHMLITDGQRVNVNCRFANTPAVLQTDGSDPLAWTWRPLYDAAYNTPSNNFDLALYPLMFLLSDGKTFMGGSHYINPAFPEDMKSRLLDLSLETWSEVTAAPIKGGSAVMYEKDLIMKAGGGLAGTQGPACDDNPVSPDVFTIDPTQQSAWTQKQSMNHRRIHFYLIALPDGKIMATGGADPTRDPSVNICHLNNAVLAPETYDPAADTWTDMAAMATPREYHSSALLLPDGSVFVGGGEASTGYTGADVRTYEIFKPPYFFQSTRPRMKWVTPEICYNKCFWIDLDEATVQPSEVTAVRLIRPGAATHSFDHSQRSIELEFATPPLGNLRVSAPSNSNIAPPGYYMVFITRNDPVRGDPLPSEARWVHLDPCAEGEDPCFHAPAF